MGSIICWEISHFINQRSVSASFVLAKSWDVAEKLLPFLLMEFSTTATQAQPFSWAKGQGAWKCCLSDRSLNDGASTVKRNYCCSQPAWMGTQSSIEEEQEKYSIGVKKEIKTVLDFSMAPLSLLLNNEMKISLRHPTTLVQSIRHPHALQATFNSLQKWN